MVWWRKKSGTKYHDDALVLDDIVRHGINQPYLNQQSEQQNEEQTVKSLPSEMSGDMTEEIRAVIADEMKLWLKDNLSGIVAETLNQVPSEVIDNKETAKKKAAGKKNKTKKAKAKDAQ